MALADPKHTLAYHSARTLTVHRNAKNVPIKYVAAAAKAFFENDAKPNTSPDQEALEFYGRNHGMALIKGRYALHEPIWSTHDLAFITKYYESMSEKTLRAFYYLLLICTRESRHNKSLSKDALTLQKTFGPSVSAFHTQVKGGESDIHKALLETPPNCTLGAYTESLVWVFNNSQWISGYGGKAWGAVADCLHRFVTGEFTAEMMLDTVWTLAHNNGPIFNKGICYGMYTTNLLHILDVQRSGQIPELVLHPGSIELTMLPGLTKCMQDLQDEFPGAFGNYVDYYKVEELGAVHKYPVQKKTQVDVHGPSTFMSEKDKADTAKAALVKSKNAALLKQYKTLNFDVHPGLSVPKTLRKAS